MAEDGVVEDLKIRLTGDGGDLVNMAKSMETIMNSMAASVERVEKALASMSSRGRTSMAAVKGTMDEAPYIAKQRMLIEAAAQNDAAMNVARKKDTAEKWMQIEAAQQSDQEERMRKRERTLRAKWAMEDEATEQDNVVNKKREKIEATHNDAILKEEQTTQNAAKKRFDSHRETTEKQFSTDYADTKERHVKEDKQRDAHIKEVLAAQDADDAAIRKGHSDAFDKKRRLLLAVQQAGKDMDRDTIQDAREAAQKKQEQRWYWMNNQKEEDENGRHGHTNSRLVAQGLNMIGLGRGHELQMMYGTQALQNAGVSGMGIASAGMAALPILAGIAIAVKMHEENRKLEEDTASWNIRLRETADHWSDIAQAQVPTTASGQHYAAAATQARNAWKETRDANERDLRSRGGDLSRIGEVMWDNLQVPGKEGTAFGRNQRLIARDIMNNQRTQARMEDREDTENDYMRRQNQKRFEFANQGSLIEGAYHDGLEKQRMQLANTRAAGLSDLKFANAEKARLEQFSYEESIRNAAKAGDTEGIKRINARHDVNVWQIGQNTKNSESSYDEVTGNMETALIRQGKDQVRREEEQAQQSSIVATSLGYQQKENLLRQHHKLMNEELNRQYESNPDSAEKKSRQAAEDADYANQTAAMGRDKALDFEREMAGYRQQTLATTRQVLPMQAQWAMIEFDKARFSGLTAEEIQKQKDAFFEMNVAASNQGFVNALKTSNIELERQHRLITDVEAARRTAIYLNPQADSQVVVDAINAQNKAMQAGMAIQTRMAIHPVEALKEYARQLKAQMDAGELSGSDAALAMKKRIYDTFGGLSPGMSGIAAPGQIDVAGLNQKLNWGKMSPALDAMFNPGVAGTSAPGQIKGGNNPEIMNAMLQGIWDTLRTIQHEGGMK